MYSIKVQQGCWHSVVAHNSPREDLGSIPGENTNWEDKHDYARRGLVSFPNNRKGGILNI